MPNKERFTLFGFCFLVQRFCIFFFVLNDHTWIGRNVHIAPLEYEGVIYQIKLSLLQASAYSQRTNMLGFDELFEPQLSHMPHCVFFVCCVAVVC